MKLQTKLFLVICLWTVILVTCAGSKKNKKSKHGKELQRGESKTTKSKDLESVDSREDKKHVLGWVKTSESSSKEKSHSKHKSKSKPKRKFKSKKKDSKKGKKSNRGKKHQSEESKKAKSKDEMVCSDSRTIQCKSRRNFEKCDVKVFGTGKITRVILGKEISRRKCEEGKNWGFDRNSIWVNSGCKAKFKVCVEGASEKTCEHTTTISCKSIRQRLEKCELKQHASGAEIVWAEVDRQLSGFKCKRGVTWWHDMNSLWVIKDCQANFKVCFKDVVNKPCSNPTTIPCETYDYRPATCVVKMSEDESISDASVQIAHHSSNCIYKQNWGYDRNAIWVNVGCRALFDVCVEVCSDSRTIWCGRNRNFDNCDVNVFGGKVTRVTLEKENKGSKCEEGKKWSFDRNSIWVNSGCAAEFTVCIEGASERSCNNTRNILCEDNGRRFEKCELKQYVSGAEIVWAEVDREWSRFKCKRGKSWGHDMNSLWVINGCQANFKVCIKGDDCGDNEEYYVKPGICDETCRNDPCIIQEVAGCYCKTGFARNDVGICINKEECGCPFEMVDENGKTFIITVKANERKVMPDCTVRECRNQVMTPIQDTQQCNSATSECVNTPKGYQCVCSEGYSGPDGYSCTPEPEPEHQIENPDLIPQTEGSQQPTSGPQQPWGSHPTSGPQQPPHQSGSSQLTSGPQQPPQQPEDSQPTSDPQQPNQQNGGQFPPSEPPDEPSNGTPGEQQAPSKDDNKDIQEPCQEEDRKTPAPLLKPKPPGDKQPECISNADEDGRYYWGSMDVTITHLPCQRWDAQTPHRHNYHHLSEEENFCRNRPRPGHLPKERPWCFTMDPETPIQYCNIPKCKTPDEEAGTTIPEEVEEEKRKPPDDEGCYNVTDFGRHYKGPKSVTHDGEICKEWKKYDYAFEDNFCRNPESDGKEQEPWCFCRASRVKCVCGVPPCNVEKDEIEKIPTACKVTNTFSACMTETTMTGSCEITTELPNGCSISVAQQNKNEYEVLVTPPGQESVTRILKRHNGNMFESELCGTVILEKPDAIKIKTPTCGMCLEYYVKSFLQLPAHLGKPAEPGLCLAS